MQSKQNGSLKLLKLIIEEVIHSEDIRNPNRAIKDIFNGRRDVIYINLNKNIFRKLENMNVDIIPIQMISQNTMRAIVYKNKEKAFKLYSIIKDRGGFLSDNTPEESRMIGELLGLNEKHINDYIQKKYSIQESVITKPPKNLNEDFQFNEIKHLMKP